MQSFSQQIIDIVWRKAQKIDGYDENVWRKDFAGAWINKNAYGTTGPYGWEVDHRRPLNKNGTDDIGNLFPCQWHNNRMKGDDYPYFKTIITSSGNQNIEQLQVWQVN